MYDQNCNTMPYRFGVKMVWQNRTRVQKNFHLSSNALNYFQKLDCSSYRSVSLIDRQNKIEIRHIGIDNVEIYMNGKFAGDVATTFDPNSDNVYAFTATAHSPTTDRSVSLDFSVDQQPMSTNPNKLRSIAIDWVQTQHCNLALGAL